MTGARSSSAAVEYHDRYRDEVRTESIYGESSLRWAYGTFLGRLTTRAIVKRALFSLLPQEIGEGVSPELAQRLLDKRDHGSKERPIFTRVVEVACLAFPPRCFCWALSCLLPA